MKIGVDVDEVVAGLHAPWIRWGNQRFGTDYVDFTHWDAPTDWWGDAAYDFLSPSIYREGGLVLPMTGAVASIAALQEMGHTVQFVSTCATFPVAAAKREWCRRHFGQGPGFVASDRKSHVAGLDLMVDDGVHNLLGFGHRGILIRRAHNASLPWHTSLASICELPHFLQE